MLNGANWLLVRAESPARQVFTLAEITGPGAIQHIWMTPTGNWRFAIPARLTGTARPRRQSKCRSADFFASGWGRYGRDQIRSPLTVNPGSAFNSYWSMPFRKSARLTVDPNAISIETEAQSSRSALVSSSVGTLVGSNRGVSQ